MSHNIGKHDRQQGLEQAWHNLTEVLPVINLMTCFLTLWDVIKRPLFRHYVPAGQTEEISEPTSACEVVCTDDPSIIIGKPVDAKSYTLLTNAGFLAVVADCIAQVAGAFVASVGSVCDRSRIFVSVAIPAYYMQDGKNMASVITAAGREFKCYLNFLSSHDRSCPFILNMGTVCTVCNNTFTMNMMDADNKLLRVVIKHTSGMMAKIANVPAIVGAFFSTVERFKEVMNHLALVPISAADAKAFVVAMLFESEEHDETATAEEMEMSTRRANQVSRIMELFATGKGNKGENLADLFSGITDYYTHESAGGTDDVGRQLANSELPTGNGYTTKARAFAIMQDDKRIAALVTRGHVILAAQPKE